MPSIGREVTRCGSTRLSRPRPRTSFGRPATASRRRWPSANGGVRWHACHPSAGARPCRASIGAGIHSAPVPRVSAHGPRAAVGRHRQMWRRSMSADLALIRAVDDASGDRASSATCSTSNSPGVSASAAPPRDRHRVEMNPPVALPREHEAIAGGPVQLAARGDALKHAARAGLRLPDLASPRPLATSTMRIDHGSAFAARREHEVLAGGGDARERDARAVGRPRRVAVEIDARVEIPQRLRSRDRSTPMKL